MAKLTAPLMSLTASGTIGKAITFSRWKGIPYARVRVIPANPKSDAQKEVRGIFSTLNEMWKRMPQLARDPWERAARGQPFTARNKHIGANVAALQDQANLDALVMGISSGSAVPFATAPGVDGTDGTITCTCTPAALPAGLTLDGAIGAACLDGDPSPVLTVNTYVDGDNAAPYLLIVDVPTDDDYQFAAWPVYIRTSDLVRFCGAPIRTQVTVSGN